MGSTQPLEDKERRQLKEKTAAPVYKTEINGHGGPWSDDMFILLGIKSR
jgi:hypothetical protein